jgi:hypothetical protein
MEKLVKKVDTVLRRKFDGATTELEMIGDKVHGLLLWEGFDGADQLDRQRRLWKILEGNFGETARTKISAIFTLTPDEIALIREEATTD